MKNLKNWEKFTLNETYRFMKGMIKDIDPYGYFVRQCMLWKSIRKFSNSFMSILKQENLFEEDMGDWVNFPENEKQNIVEFLKPYIKEYVKDISINTINNEDVFNYLSGCKLSFKDINDYKFYVGDVVGRTPLDGRSKIYIDLNFHISIDWGSYPSNFSISDGNYFIVYHPNYSIALFRIIDDKICLDDMVLTSMDKHYQETKWLKNNVKIIREL